MYELLNKLCIEINEDIDFDDVMRKLSKKIDSIDTKKMENALYKAWINDTDFDFDFEYDDDFGRFDCNIAYTGSCIFIEAYTKYLCIKITEMVEKIIEGSETFV